MNWNETKWNERGQNEMNQMKGDEIKRKPSINYMLVIKLINDT